MRERLVCAALLVCVGFVLSGCGEGHAPAPADAATTGNTAVESAPSDSDISVVVRDHVQDRLVTSSLHSSDLARAGMGMPPNFGPPGGMPPGPFGSPPGFGPGGPPPGNDPAARYEAQLIQGSRQFSLTTEKPQIAKERDEQIIKAHMVDVRITHRKARTETHHEISFEVEQELLTDLYKLATSSELQKAIQWDTKRVSSAMTAAKKIAEPKRSKLDQQWKQLLASRAWVLEKEHATGSRWTATGKIQSRLVDSKWVHEVTQLRPRSSISRQIVARNRAAGLARCRSRKLPGVGQRVEPPLHRVLCRRRKNDRRIRCSRRTSESTTGGANGAGQDVRDDNSRNCTLGDGQAASRGGARERHLEWPPCRHTN